MGSSLGTVQGATSGGPSSGTSRTSRPVVQASPLSRGPRQRTSSRSGPVRRLMWPSTFSTSPVAASTRHAAATDSALVIRHLAWY